MTRPEDHAQAPPEIVRQCIVAAADTCHFISVARDFVPNHHTAPCQKPSNR